MRYKLLLLLCTVLFARRAHALDSEKRLEFIRNVMETNYHSTKIWSRNWTIGFSIVGAGQLAATPFVSDGNRTDMYYGAGSTMLSLLPLVIFPPQILSDRNTLNTLQDEHPENLAIAERLFEQSAKDEARRRHWPMHVANTLVNMGMGLALGFGHNHWTSAGIFMGSGIVIGEAFLLTQPHGLVDDWRLYNEGFLQ